MNERDVPKTGWVKYWESPLRPLFNYVGCRLQNLGQYVDKEAIYTHLLIDYRDSVTSCYYLEKELEDFQAYAVAYIASRNNMDHLETETTAVIETIEELLVLPSYTTADIERLQRVFDWMHFFTSIVKTAGDAAIDEATFEQVLSLRKKTEKVYFNLYGVLVRIAEQIAAKAGVSKEAALALSDLEVISFFESGILPAMSVLEQRDRRLVLHVTPKGFFELSESEYEPILRALRGEIETTTVRGQSAYRGVVRGVASVILDFTSGVDMPEGNVLVTGMTDPRFVPVMKKASAIVTDAGGMLCHAAIVSRELKKPCVVGTRIATQAIKNGDLVEVDADSGIVRIIR